MRVEANCHCWSQKLLGKKGENFKFLNLDISEVIRTADQLNSPNTLLETI